LLYSLVLKLGASYNYHWASTIGMIKKKKN